MENKFELIVRALIIQNKKSLVCKNLGSGYFYLPGGHIEFGESMKEALERELREEIGAKIIKSEFIGAIENLFIQKNRKRHEVSFVFKTEIDLPNPTSQEKHLEFSWMNFEEFLKADIKPAALKDAIAFWRAQKQTFFIQSETDD